MRKSYSFFRKNRVKILLIGLIIGNIALFQLTSSIFLKNKKAEVQEEDKNKTSYFQGGIYIIHLGNAVVDYFRLFGEKDDRQSY
ncbi:MAG TPA: hypothetical protein DIW47_04050 [Bacteroidetes bacterium]|nr:hypothetical protein [Bacteroidota bacterium]